MIYWLFSCYAIDDDTVIRLGDTVVLYPRDPRQRRIPPSITTPEEHEQVDFTTVADIDIVCEARGSPPPTVAWFQNDVQLGEDKLKRNVVLSWLLILHLG